MTYIKSEYIVPSDTLDTAHELSPKQDSNIVRNAQLRTNHDFTRFAH
jgi:hypothetical protein